MQNKPTSALTKGLVISLLLVVFSLIINFTGSEDNSVLQYVGFAIFLIGIIWSIASYGKQIDHNATFGKYFMHGFAITAIITCLMIIFMAIFMSIDPSIKQKALEKASEAMDKNPALSDEQKQQALEISKKFFLVGILASTLVLYLLFGVIASLVTAAIVKKNPRNIFDEQDIDALKPIQ